MQNQTKQLQRSIDRLSHFFDNPNTSNAAIIPSLYYTADHLNKYAIKQFKNNNINHKYFVQFNNRMEKFILRDLSDIKVHEKQLIGQILDIVNSQLFIACLHPQRKFYKKSSIIPKLEQHNQQRLMEIDDKQTMIASKFWQSQSIDLKNNPKFSSSLRESRALGFSKIHASHINSKIKKTASQIKLDDATQLYQQIKSAYQEHKIDVAHKLILKYEQRKFPIVQNCGPFFDMIQSQYETMIQMAKQLDKPGWKHQKSKNGIHIYSLVDKNDPLAGVKMESEFQIPIENIMAILCQMDLMKQYTPYCFESKLMTRPVRNKVIGYSQVSIPLLTNREACIQAVGYDRIQQNGTIFMASKSIDDVNQILQLENTYGIKFPRKQGFVSLKYKYFVIQYTPVSIDRAKVRIASKVDMQISFAPMFVLKSSAITFGLDYFNNIKQINKKFSGSAWDYKMKQNPQLYNFFINKIAEHNIAGS